MNQKDLEFIIEFLKTQSLINLQIEAVITNVGTGSPHFQHLRKLITQNRKLLSEFENKTKEN